MIVLFNFSWMTMSSACVEFIEYNMERIRFMPEKCISACNKETHFVPLPLVIKLTV